MQVREVTAVGPEVVRSWHRVLGASLAADLPDEPRPSEEQLAAQLTGPSLGSRRLLWAAGSGDDTVGVAALRLFTDPGRDHLGELTLHVAPAARRRGVGTELLAAALDAARREARRAVVAEVVDGTAGPAFAQARGLRPVLAVSYLLLQLAEASAVGVVDGYRPVHWTGVVPDELADAFAVAKASMEDMPTGGLDYGEVRWDAERVRAMARVVADRGDLLLTTAAVSDDGLVAGFTEVVLPGGRGPRAQQYDTVVVPAHRGHGLGLWLKSAMVERLRAERPDVTEVATDNADDNVHMLAVNERLGFRRCRRSIHVQAELT